MVKVTEAEKYMEEWSKFSPEALQIYLEYLEGITSHGPETEWQDIMGLREMHRRHYPKIKVDTLARVFTSHDDFMSVL